MKHFLLVATCFHSFGRIANGVTVSSGTTASMEMMKRVFYRSEEMHSRSMASLSRSMSTSKAIDLLKERNITSPALLQVAKQTQTKTNLRVTAPDVDGAKKLLNNMIFESMSKYDMEIAYCTDFYTTQCAAMEVCRGDISGTNYICANSRSLILDSQACIERAEEGIEHGKEKLAQLRINCKHEKDKMTQRLKLLDGDLAVLTKILTMTDCDSSFVQTTKVAVLKCQDPCTKKWYFSFNHEALRKDMSELQSSVSHDLVHESLSDLFSGIEGLKATEFLQSNEQYSPVVNTTRWQNKPVPRTEMPQDPCTDPNGGAPSMADKRAAKCILGPGQCTVLQERFLLIQSGIQDEHDELSDELEQLKLYCDDTETTLQDKISHNQKTLSACETNLAEATKKENEAAEDGRTTAKEHSQLDDKLKRQMKTCSTNYINYEGEICALKKIRGEVYKMQSPNLVYSGVGMFTDCSVSKWSALQCSNSCGGGQQILQRSVMIHPNGGAPCLPLEMEKTCNAHPCPVDCVLETWSGWSKCSADCGAGVMQRLREVRQAMKYGGRPCSSTSETKSCNNQACETACVLADWTTWSTCSKECDGGTMRRQKSVKTAADGAGSCPDKWTLERLEYKTCNNIACPLDEIASFPAMICKATLDIVLLIDGSGSLGATGWAAEKKAASLFVDSFRLANADTQIAVILFSGPSTWSGVYKCIGRDAANVDLETVCKIKPITHFTPDLVTVKAKIDAMTWPRGSTLTSVALESAKGELTLGRKDSHAIIIVFTDGRPLSRRKTYFASMDVRKSARLVWVPVTSYAPLQDIKSWATRRWEENVVVVKSFADLEKPDVVTHIIANICPVEPPSMTWR